MKMARHTLTLLTDRRGPRFEEGICKEKAPPKPGLDRPAYRTAPRPFVTSGPAYPMMPSWNQVVGFLTDWEGFRLAVLAQVQCSEELRHVAV
jgi:hypothetical protein